MLIPIGVVLRLYHNERTGPYEEDASLAIEQNPYFYNGIKPITPSETRPQHRL
jgi:hypothetical protein